MDVNMNTINEFCESHGIKVIDNNKRAYKFNKLNTAYFTDPTSLDNVYQTISYETEPLLTIEISASELEKIANFEQQVFNNLKTQGHYDLFNTMIAQKQLEKQIRSEYPAVQKAYENYSLVLKLASEGKL